MTRRALVVLGAAFAVLAMIATLWWVVEARDGARVELKRGSDGLADWCSSMATIIGPGSPFPTMERLVEVALERGADPQPGHSVFTPGSPEGKAAYRVYFDWFPPVQVEAAADLVRAVVADAIDGDPIEVTSADALRAGRSVDRFIADECR